MDKIRTEAWVLEAGALKREEFVFDPPAANEVLAEPIFGCWEGNMTHALLRDPIDINKQRSEKRVVIGNAGVVRVVDVGKSVSRAHPGDYCVFMPSASVDAYGYTALVAAYDAPGTIGLLAKKMKCADVTLCPIPPGSKYSLQQWAAFSLRYPTAWANWKLALGAWRLQVAEDQCAFPDVWGWGGGVTFAQATLAQRFGARTAITASSERRLKMLREAGILAVDRREFPDLRFDAELFAKDAGYREKYLASEGIFLDRVKQSTHGKGVDIFIDNIGAPVFRATLKALAREGVIATCGWKEGTDLSFNRAVECVNHRLHVFTHGAKYSEGEASVAFADQNGWLPPQAELDTWEWEKIDRLAEDFGAGKVDSYFPLYQVHTH